MPKPKPGNGIYRLALKAADDWLERECVNVGGVWANSTAINTTWQGGSTASRTQHAATA